MILKERAKPVRTPQEMRVIYSQRARRLCVESGLVDRHGKNRKLERILENASTNGTIQFWMDRIKFGLFED